MYRQHVDFLCVEHGTIGWLFDSKKKKKIDMKTNKKKATKKSTTAIYDKRK